MRLPNVIGVNICSITT